MIKNRTAYLIDATQKKSQIRIPLQSLEGDSTRGFNDGSSCSIGNGRWYIQEDHCEDEIDKVYQIILLKRHEEQANNSNEMNVITNEGYHLEHNQKGDRGTFLKSLLLFVFFKYPL